MVIVIIEMPLLVQGITCIYCGFPIHDDYVYSVEGNTYRCVTCAGKLIKRIKELRDDGTNKADVSLS